MDEETLKGLKMRAPYIQDIRIRELRQLFYNASRDFLLYRTIYREGAPCFLDFSKAVFIRFGLESCGGPHFIIRCLESKDKACRLDTRPRFGIIDVERKDLIQ